MYAPVVSRFYTYDIGISQVAGAYMQAVMALPAWQEWQSAARDEPWTCQKMRWTGRLCTGFDAFAKSFNSR